MEAQAQTLAPAPGIYVPKVKHADPPSLIERLISDPTNILLIVLIVVAVVGIYLYTQNKSKG